MPPPAPADGDTAWMRRCLRLAVRSLGRTWPNPGVACLVVRQNTVIGHGRHRRCGDPHAEILALDDCRRRGHDPAGASVYITLAPCTRHGRTPPCCEALIAAGVARVVAAIPDPAQDDPKSRLAAHGISYRCGVCAEEAAHLHGGFLTRIRCGRPRFTGKWAMSLDGCLAASNGRSAWISSQANLRATRRRRRAYDGILVGGGTARNDDPRLLALRPEGGTPLRIVVAGDGDLGPDPRRILTDTDRFPVLVVHDERCTPLRRHALAAHGVGLRAVANTHDAAAVAQALGAYGLNEVLVEGGATLHGAWLRTGLYDRLEIATGALTPGGGLAVALGPGADDPDHGSRWLPEVQPYLQGDTCCWRLRRTP